MNITQARKQLKKIEKQLDHLDYADDEVEDLEIEQTYLNGFIAGYELGKGKK